MSEIGHVIALALAALFVTVTLVRTLVALARGALLVPASAGAARPS